MTSSVQDPIELLGCIAKDVQTGFQGSVRGVTFYAYGCTHVLLQPTELKDDGGIRMPHAFDEGRIELIKEPKRGVKKKTPNFGLGNHVKDCVTGIEGFVSGYTIWVDGPIEYFIEPYGLNADGVPHNGIYMYEERIYLVAAIPPKVGKKALNPPGAPTNSFSHRTIG